MKIKTLTLATALLIAVVACQPAQDIPATPSTPYWPSYLDYDITARLKAQGNRFAYAGTRGYYPSLAAIYVARECFAGNPLTPEGFRTFVGQMTSPSGSGRALMEVALVRQFTGKLLALQGKDVRGSCIEPFIYPKTGEEAYLGQVFVTIELRKGYGQPSTPYKAWLENQLPLFASQWFQQEAKSRGPFVPWLWARPELGIDPLTPVPSSVPVPKGATRLPPTWAKDYQASVMQMNQAQ